jgi:signal transduction histidine kinase
MLSHFIQVQYCYDYLVNQIPVGLLLYSHIPTALIALVFSTYVFIRSRNLPSVLLFCMCVTFAAWSAFDLSAWFSFLGSANTMFVWSLLDFLAVLMFFFGYYFLYTFVTEKDLPLWQKIIGVLAIIPNGVTALLGINLLTYNLDSCEAVENSSYTVLTYYAEGFFIISALFFVAYHYRKINDRAVKTKTLLTGIGVLTLLLFFFSAGLLVSILTGSDASLYAYNYLIYGLFGMPLFLMYLGYLIVRYHAFDVRIFGTQALVLALVALIGSEFAFVTTLSNQILVGVTLVLTAFIGIILIRSVKKEIKQRQHIELLAKDLEQANDSQVILIHFITHQIKGFVAKSRNIFSMALEGDFGPVGPELKPMLQAGFDSDTKGATVIQEILNAANIKSGKVTYTMEAFDLGPLIEDMANYHNASAKEKGVSVLMELGTEPVRILGDRAQLMNVFKNVIDNSIKYTPQGEVRISLTPEPQKKMVLFAIKDTGVGITSEDMKNLFTEGGHGKDSVKVNVESTGFGLYIVKQIVDAHKGRVWAESEGAGKGTQLYIELPAA